MREDCVDPGTADQPAAKLEEGAASRPTALAWLQAQEGRPLPAQDVVWLMLPLMKAVADLHDQGRVASVDPSSVWHDESQGLMLRQPGGQPPQRPEGSWEQVRQLDPPRHGALQVLGETRIEHAPLGESSEHPLHLHMDPDQPITRPVLLPGWTCWERALGLHDALTDIFQLGQLLAALACGLDLNQSDDVQAWARHLDQPQRLTTGLHPVLAALIRDMCALSRHQRAQELWQPIERLLHWQDAADLAGPTLAERLAAPGSAATRKAVVLSHLRDRLFDLSKRNRLLHYRPGQGSVNLTTASVPMVLQVERIQPDDLALWQGPFAKAVLAGKPVTLNRWLKLDEQPDVAPGLDRLISDARRDRAEYGFSPLRLVVAFLRWHNLKEDPETRIESPLLWLPASLGRQRGVRDQYQLQCEGSEAEFNPVLRHQLRQLYGIQLPERIDLATTTLSAVHDDLQAQIRASDPAVSLRLLTMPAIRLVREKAQQRLQLYRRRHRLATPPVGLPPYSYDPQDYRPLGQALFEARIRPRPLPQRLRAGGSAARPHDVRAWQLDAPAAPAEQVGFSLELPPGDQHVWDLDLTQLTLANFQYKKMSLVKDYQQLLESPSTPATFEQLFASQARQPAQAEPPLLPEAAQHPVVPLDATQTAAVALARTGRSFIIQGPPGTGKSQTITNLIADYAAQGRRVLFVCEKRAALDVVFHRLRQSGLAPLCTLIHDSQDDKKAFIADLKACYESWLQQPCDLPGVTAGLEALLHELMHHLGHMASFDQAMNAVPPEVGQAWRQLLRRQLTLSQAHAPHGQWLAALSALPPAERAALPPLATWDQHRALIQQVGHALAHLGLPAVLARHPGAKLAPSFWLGVPPGGRPDAQIAPWLERAQSALSALEDLPGLPALALPAWTGHRDPDSDHDRGHLPGPRDASSQPEPGPALGTLLRLMSCLSGLQASGLGAHHALLLDSPDPSAGAPASALKTAVARRAQAQEAVVQARQACSAWRKPLQRDDTLRALATARQLEGHWLRWLQPAWWQLRRVMQAHYDFSAHALPPRPSEALAALAKLHEAEAAQQSLDAELGARFGVPDPGTFLAEAARWADELATDPAARQALAALERAPEGVRQALSAGCTQWPGDLKEALHAMPGLAWLPASEAAEACRDLQEALDDLDTLQPSLAQLASAAPGLLALLARHDQAPEALEAWLVQESLSRLDRQHPALSAFDSRHLTRHAEEARTLQARRRPLEARRILLQAQSRFLHHVQRASLPASQLDADGKAFRKAYGTGRRELEHEFGKSIRHRAIRDLADDETGLVLRDLKPVWLMSPLSVSETLPLDPALFDVVIFDEASQIPTEEAIPALCRAPQVVVVGDEMQLPPSQFFSASHDDDESLSVEEEGETHRIQLDADSLLSQAARQLPATLLAWHYRSRHEALISFSNAAFYGGQLVTVPDRPLPGDAAPAGRAGLDQSDGAPHGVASVQGASPGLAQASASVGLRHLLAQPLSVHRLSDGVYLQRRNVAEATYIAHLVRQYLLDGPGMSLGIVAFSEAQQGCIEEALQALAKDDAAFAQRLDAETLREDDDQFNGLFIKNLENVQGDERDVMLLSICYAPGPDGRMAMNFGPINQRGGEKRLNVIFSRARHRMAVICSIEGEAITNIHNDGASALRTFLLFARACAEGQESRARSLLGQLGESSSQAFMAQPEADSVRQALAAALRERGHEVRLHVGQSRWRVDVAVRAAQGSGPTLALLLDQACPSGLAAGQVHGQGEPARHAAEHVAGHVAGQPSTRPAQGTPGAHAHAWGQESHVFRPGLLRAFGWQAMTLHAKDWLNDPQGVLARIETVLSGQPDPATVEALPGWQAPSAWTPPAGLSWAGQPGPVTPPGALGAQAVQATLPLEHADDSEDGAQRGASGAGTASGTSSGTSSGTLPGAGATGHGAPDGALTPPCAPAAAAPDQSCRLRCQEGTSNKFWHIERHGAELLVRYGRVGQAGQQLRKPFDAAERAAREFDKLVAEKLRKGYGPEEPGG